MLLTGPRVKIVLQRRTRVSDQQGGSNDIWNDIIEFRGVLSPYKMSVEQLLYNKETVEYDHVLYCKHLSENITHYDRIVYGNRYFHVKAVNTPLMESKIMKIYVKEIK